MAASRSHLSLGAAGEIVELGRPRDLLEGTAGHGYFRKLCDESADGDALYAALDLKRTQAAGRLSELRLQ